MLGFGRNLSILAGGTNPILTTCSRACTPHYGSASVLQTLKRSSSIFTSVYVAVQKLNKALARASVQLGWQCQAERCRSPLRS
ncbi:hypothetical protein Tco_0614054 [Tanacetum coccineum]